MKTKNIYNLFTRNGKKTEQKGRSTIEMLGVLAIMAVLTVVGITGFSHFMEKYKIEKTKEEMHLISNNILMAMYNAKDYSALAGGMAMDDCNSYPGTCMAVKLGLIPEHMIRSDGSVVHSFGGDVNIYPVSVSRQYDAFKVEFMNLPRQAIIEMSMSDGNVSNRNLLDISISGGSYANNGDVMELLQ